MNGPPRNLHYQQSVNKRYSFLLECVGEIESGVSGGSALYKMEQLCPQMNKKK